MSRVVLDAGALIALERNDREMWAVITLASANGRDIVVPTTALAQAWRGTASQALLARALQQCLLAPFDRFAKEVGQLLGKTKTADICDAHVALVATAAGGVLFTSDPQDLRRLVAACGRFKPTIVRC